MELNVREAAALLRVSTKTIYRWVGDGKIPGYRVSNSLRFDRTELLEWATAHRIEAAPERLSAPADADPLPGFDEALLAGGVFYRVEGSTRDEVLANVVRLMRLDDEAERDRVLEALRAREALAPTVIGEGIALPHLRNPLRFHFARPSVSLCFLERAVDWGAFDGERVHTLFVTAGATTRAVLQLQARTACALRDAGFREAIVARASRETIHAEARRVAGGWVR